MTDFMYLLALAIFITKLWFFKDLMEYLRQTYVVLYLAMIWDYYTGRLNI